MCESWWLKSNVAQHRIPTHTNLSDKQVFALTEYFASPRAGRCFFKPDEFADYERALDSRTVAPRGSARSSISFKPGGSGHSGNWTAAKTLIGKTAEQTIGQALKGVKELEHVHWSAHQETHHTKDASLMTAIGAGLVNYILMFSFCCVYGMLIFIEPGHADHRILGIKMCVTSAVVMGFMLSRISKIPIAIGGPDMNAVIFIGGFVTRISEVLVQDLHLDESTIKGPDEAGFCIGAHYLANSSACDSYNKQLRATVIFSVTISTVVLSVFFLIIGGCHLTLYISYMPTSIVDAFLSCMGYKVFKFAIKLCDNDPTMIVPAAGVGVPLYFLKAMHIGNPMFVMPTMMSLPFIIHHVVMASHGWNAADARDRGYLFDVFHHEDFYSVWKDGPYMNGKNINWAAWWNTKYELVVMLIVCVLDCLVTAIRTTESKLPVKVHKDWEMMVGGVGDLVGALFGSVGGYLQLKFNVMNFGILQNATDRRAGGILVLAMGITFFVNIDFLNYLPKVFICMLLFFSASSFVAEHLWGSKDYLSRHEWCQVFIILVIFILTESIMFAVTVGITMCGITFIMQYSYIPCIAGRPLRGGEIYSREYYTPMVSVILRHIADNWLLVIRLKGFIFFASVQVVSAQVRRVFKEEADRNVPVYERIKFILLDCELLDGMDSSAEKEIQMLVQDAAELDVRILWSSVPKSHLDLMINRRTISHKQDVFHDLETAILHIEGLILEYRRKQQLLWEELHPAFALNRQLICLRESFEPFMNVLRFDVERFGCPWEFCSRLKIRRCRTCLWAPNEQNRELFLVHTGAVGVFHELPDEEGEWNDSKALAVYRHGWLINRESVMKMPTNNYAVCVEDGEVIFWSRHQWWRMSREQPGMAQAILEAAMKQANMDIERMSKDAHQSVKATVDEEVVAQSVLHAHHRDDFDSGEGIANNLPSDLINRLEDLEAAQSLESFRLYEPLHPGEPGVLPSLPMVIRRDLEIAFNTYCVPKGKSQVIMWEKVNEALMYAGIFNTLLEKKHAELTQAEFIHVGHEAALMRLNSHQLCKVYNVFKEWPGVGDDGRLSRDDLIVVFKSSFLPNITEQEVNGIANTWDDDGSGAIEVAEFVSIVSRFVRRHEQDWNLLRGFRAVLKKPDRTPVHDIDLLNVRKLIDFANQKWSAHVTTDECAEMLWANSCFGRIISPKEVGKLLDWSGIAAAVLLHIDRPYGKLPPPPIQPEVKDRRGATTRGNSVFVELKNRRKEFQDIENSSSESSRSEDDEHEPHKTVKAPEKPSGDYYGGKFSVGSQFTLANIMGKREDCSAPSELIELDDLANCSGGEAEAVTTALLSPTKSQSEEASTGVGKGGRGAQKKPRRKRVKRQSPVDVKSVGMTLLSSYTTDSQHLKEASSSCVHASESLSLGLPFELPITNSVKSVEEGARAPPSTPANRLARESAKEKLCRASGKIWKLAEEKIRKECQMTATFHPLSECVIDLRNYSSESAAPTLFCKTRLSRTDFAEENRKSIKRRMHHGYQWEGGVPSTPDAKIFLLLEDPSSSTVATYWSRFMSVMIVLSVTLLFLKPLIFPKDSNMSNDQKMYWKVVECCFTIVFLGELVVRFAVCAALKTQTHLEFMMQPLNICDFVSVLPFFLEIIAGSNEEDMKLLRIARLMRLARVMRLARLSRKSSIFGPAAFVFSIIWGIYLRERELNE